MTSMNDTTVSTSRNRPDTAIWQTVLPLAELSVGDRHLYRKEAQRIAIFRLDHDEIFAIDDRCPHEGYPLSKGSVSGTVLTCQWHNFKFDLQSGHCLKGNENVRSYPTRIRAGVVEVDLSEEDPDKLIEEKVRSLRDGLRLSRMGQVARDSVRLLQLGVEPMEVAYLAAKYDSEVGEYGTTHVLPVVVDSMVAFDRYPGLEAVVPILQGMDLAADFHVRQPQREKLSPTPVSGSASEIFSSLRELVESERGLEAEAMLAGAIEAGVSPREIEAWLYHFCSDHFLGFGHALIYTTKAFELLAKVGWNKASEILPALLFNIVNQTREELVPEWKWYCTRLSEIEGELPVWYEQDVRPPEEGEVSTLSSTVLDGTRTESFDAIAAALRSGLDRESLVNALSLAASERILRFDPSIDQNSTVQEGWLAVTHLLTFASAVRCSLERFDHPAVLKLLLFAGRFINNAKALDLPIEDRISKAVKIESKVRIGDVTIAIESQNVQKALTGSIALCTSPEGRLSLREFCEDFSMSDHTTKPIVIGHLIKTCRVAFDEAESTGDLASILAFVKVAASPLRQRWITRLAHEAIAFLGHGKVPRTLT